MGQWIKYMKNNGQVSELLSSICWGCRLAISGMQMPDWMVLHDVMHCWLWAWFLAYFVLKTTIRNFHVLVTWHHFRSHFFHLLNWQPCRYFLCIPNLAPFSKLGIHILLTMSETLTTRLILPWQYILRKAALPQWSSCSCRGTLVGCRSSFRCWWSLCNSPRTDRRTLARPSCMKMIDHHKLLTER